jgi:HEAT repeat protein
MSITELVSNKDLKPAEKTATLGQWLLVGTISMDELLAVAKQSKDAAKATCIEAIEFATQKHPEIATTECLSFVSQSLSEKASRVKWESAKVVGNIAQQFPQHLDEAIQNLLVNTEHNGTVVRWSAAFALGQIIQTPTKQAKNLIPTIQTICEREEKNSIQKMYTTALKKAGY